RFVLHTQHRAEHARIERGGIAVGGLHGDRAWLALGSRGVDGDVDPAEARDRSIDQSTNVLVFADVSTDERDLGAETAELHLQCLPGLGIPPTDDEPVTLTGCGNGGGATNAGKRAGDQDDLLRHDQLLDSYEIKRNSLLVRAQPTVTAGRSLLHFSDDYVVV